MKNLYLLVFAICLFNPSLFAQSFDVATLSGLEYGPHPVGFQFLKTFDPSRGPILEQKNKSQRITPIYLWYPGKKKSKRIPEMSLNDYLSYWAYETDYNVSSSEIFAAAQRNFARSFLWVTDISDFQTLYESKLTLKAQENIPMLEGKHPLVILSHGAMMNWQFMAEFLASHGYAVALAPVAGTYDKRLEASISGVTTELRDAEHILSQVQKFPQIDLEKIATVGNSLGSVAAVAMATKNPSVRAVVSLDGVIGSPNEGSLLHEMSYYDDHEFTVPLLHTTGGFSFSNNRELINNFEFSNRFILELNGMRHADFIGQGLYDTLGVKMTGSAAGDYREAYRQLQKHTLFFLNAYLKNQENEWVDLFQKEEVSPLISSKTHIANKAKNYSFAQLINFIFELDFDALFAVYQQHKDLKIKAFSYNTFHDVGMQMIFRQHFAEAKQWFLYFSESYPNSAKAKYLLGSTLERLEQGVDAQLILREAQNLMKEDPFLSTSQKELYSNRIESKLKRFKGE